MSFNPIVPVGGIAGFRFIEETYDRQVDAFSRRPDIARDIAYWTENAAKATTAEAFVQDPTLMRVALGAFGLADQTGKIAFVRKILEDGTIDPQALANRLASPQWKELSRELGFGDVGGLLGVRSTRETIAELYRIRSFEEAVGAQDGDLATALAFRREVGAIATGETVDRTGWFTLMGRRDLRPVVEAAFGLPDAFGALDIDRQAEVLENRARREFGSPSAAVFADPANVETVIRKFLVISQARSGPSDSTPGMTALTLLQSARIGPQASTNLFASRFL